MDVFKNQEVSTSWKLFIPILISLLFYNNITLGEFFSCKDKDSWILKLKQSFHFKAATCFTESDNLGQNILELLNIFYINGNYAKDSLKEL